MVNRVISELEFEQLHDEADAACQWIEKQAEKIKALEAERAQLNTIVIGLKMEMDKLEAECKRLAEENDGLRRMNGVLAGLKIVVDGSV